MLQEDLLFVIEFFFSQRFLFHKGDWGEYCKYQRCYGCILPSSRVGFVFEIPAVFDCCSDMRADMGQITNKLENLETQQEHGHQVSGHLVLGV